MKMDFSKLPIKSTYISATFVRNFITKNFQKSPNLVTLAACYLHRTITEVGVSFSIHLNDSTNFTFTNISKHFLS